MKTAELILNEFYYVDTSIIDKHIINNTYIIQIDNYHCKNKTIIKSLYCYNIEDDSISEGTYFNVNYIKRKSTQEEKQLLINKNKQL